MTAIAMTPAEAYGWIAFLMAVPALACVALWFLVRPPS